MLSGTIVSPNKDTSKSLHAWLHRHARVDAAAPSTNSVCFFCFNGGSGFRVKGLGLRDKELVQGSGIKVCGLRFRI